MPRGAVRAKKEAVLGYGGSVIECGPSYASREAALAGVQEATGADVVHPYDDPRVIAGQATCSRELIDQAGGLDAAIAPIGGGGMVSGTCLTLSDAAPGTIVYAAEPEQADDAARSLRAGRIIADDAPETVADGLKAPLKDMTWHFVSRHVADILTVSEREIVDADEAGLGTDEDRDRAVERGGGRRGPEKPGRLRRQAGRRDPYRRQCRSGESAMGRGRTGRGIVG